MQTRSEASPPAPPSVTGSEVGKEGAVTFGENRVSRVWIHSPSQLINEALGALLTRAGCEGGEVLARADSQADANIAIADIAIADIAVWDLRSLGPPYPRPPDLPTLALIGQSDAAKEGALQAGYRGYLSGEETADEVGRARRGGAQGGGLGGAPRPQPFGHQTRAAPADGSRGAGSPPRAQRVVQQRRRQAAGARRKNRQGLRLGVALQTRGEKPRGTYFAPRAGAVFWSPARAYAACEHSGTPAALLSCPLLSR